MLDSTDGRIWQRQQRGPDGSISEVAARPGQVLAAGSRNVQDAYGTIALWLSRDGLNWSAVPDAASLHSRHGEFLTMAAILPTDEGWLAVGGESLMCVPAACRLVRAVAWTSPDGLEWTRSADSAAMEHAQMTGVVRTQTGFLAVGAAAVDPSRPGSAIRPAVWTSADGRSWTRSDGLPVVKAAQDADVTLDSVARVGRHVVAVGHVTAPSVAGADAFAWWSEGADWSSVAVGRNATSGDVRVAAIPDGMLAMFAFGSDSSCRSPIWMSADGASWDCIGNDPVFAGSAVWDAAWAPEVEVLVGSGADGAVVWTSALH